MKPTPKFKGWIKDGSFIPDNIVKHKQRLLELEGKQVNQSLVRYRENRSNNQNRYYWGVVIEMIADHCGYGKEDHEGLSDELKRKFLGTHGDLQIAVSSASLNTKEFEDYMSSIRTWAGTGGAGLPLYIPLPNEVDY